MKPILGVGWDVGGWLGKKQAVAAVTWSGTERMWRGSSDCFSVQPLDQQGASLLDFIRLAWRDAPDDVLEQYRVVLAIDAPLGFPTAFRQLLASDLPHVRPIGAEINNRFAYRATDRHIHTCFGKKPLSASFDTLGNVATVALWHARHWAEQSHMRIVPQQSADDTDHTIIEVYPALVKPGRLSACHAPLAALMPADVLPGTDQYDAAICALLALSFGMTGLRSTLPKIVHPHGIADDDLATEGWIYYVEQGWLTGAEQERSRNRPS